MKTKFIILAVVSLIGTATAYAEKRTEKLDVKGNCGMCKTRIEKAAKSVSGVSKANWNKETKVLQLTFDDSKTNLKTIETTIAKAGHDTPQVKASDETYNALHDCCKYDRSDSSDPQKAATNNHK